MTTRSDIFERDPLDLRMNLLEEEENDMNQEIRIQSNEEVEEMQGLEVEELFWQTKSQNIKCLRNYVFICFHLL